MPNDKQQRFCEEYLTDLNATQAAIRAGYSKISARFTGSHLLALQDIKDMIAQLIRNRSDETDVLQHVAMRKLWEIANADIKDYLSFGPRKVMVIDPGTGVQTEKNMGMQVTVKESDLTDTRNIAEISLKKNGDFKFKLGNREKALALLVRHIDTMSKFTGNQDRYRETIEPIFLIPENEDGIIEEDNTND